MKALLDTSVLVATFYADHEHHKASLDLFLDFTKRDAGCGAHSLAEVYAILAHCAIKSKASIVYTWNTKDFLRINPAIAGRVRRPDQH